MEAQMQEMEARLNGFAGRQKGNAMSVQERVNAQVQANLLMSVIGAWYLSTKVTLTAAYFTSKLESKSKQMNSVKTMFKSFAGQLDKGLAPDSASSRSKPGASQKPGSSRQAESEGVHLPPLVEAK